MKINRNGWVIATCVIVLLGILTTSAGLWVSFDMVLNDGVRWDQLKLNPFNLLDVAILLAGGIGVWFKRWGFALLLVCYQGLQVAFNFYRFATGTTTLVILIGAIIILAVYFQAYISLKPTKSSESG